MKDPFINKFNKTQQQQKKHIGKSLGLKSRSLEPLATIIVRWLDIVKLTQTQLSLGGNSSWGIVSIRLAYGHVCEAFFWIANWCRRAQATVGGTTPRKGGLSYIRKVTEQAMGKVYASSFCLDFLPGFPQGRMWLGHICQINSFLTKMLLVMALITSIENQSSTKGKVFLCGIASEQ